MTPVIGISSQAVIAVLVSALCLALRRYCVVSNAQTYPRPPGPKGWPLIGSMLDMPTGKQWLGYDAWLKTYGDMVYLEVLGRPYLILGSMRRTRDLFEKRSSICSDRPHFTMSYDLIGFDFLFTVQHYGEWWRRHRRTFHEYFHAGAVKRYLPIQTATALQFVKRLESSPHNLMRHIRQTFSTTIMKIAYDIDVRETNDQYVLLAEETLDIFATTLLPGLFYVDMLPILKYVPSWTPGAGFKRKAAKWRITATDFLNRPFRVVQDAMNHGGSPTCMAADLIANLPTDETRAEEEQIAKNVTAIAYAGGADTTISAAQSFFLAMVLFPDVQKKAQAEIDRIIGLDRFPDFDDRDVLPYIGAVIKETMRWQLVTPLAVPHRTTEELVYDGYLIPKGTVIIGNSWSILHDPEAYPDPEEFKPERYLKDGELDPNIPDPGACGAFGFGRRICPGRFMSDNSLYSVVASVLAVYDITPVPGEQLPSAEMVPGVLSYPVPFRCVIKPRSAAAQKLVASISTM